MIDRVRGPAKRRQSKGRRNAWHKVSLGKRRLGFDHGTSPRIRSANVLVIHQKLAEGGRFRWIVETSGPAFRQHTRPGKNEPPLAGISRGIPIKGERNGLAEWTHRRRGWESRNLTWGVIQTRIAQFTIRHKRGQLRFHLHFWLFRTATA